MGFTLAALITNDFDDLLLGLAAHTEPLRGCGTRRKDQGPRLARSKSHL